MTVSNRSQIWFLDWTTIQVNKNSRREQKPRTVRSWKLRSHSWVNRKISILLIALQRSEEFTETNWSGQQISEFVQFANRNIKKNIAKILQLLGAKTCKQYRRASASFERRGLYTRPKYWLKNVTSSKRSCKLLYRCYVCSPHWYINQYF